MLKVFLEYLKYILFALPVVSILLTDSINAQTKTNFDIFYSLIDSSVNEISKELNKDAVYQVQMQLGTVYGVFGNEIKSAFASNGLKFKSDSDSIFNILTFVLEEASVEYGDIFRDGIFSNFLTERTVNIQGNYSIESKGEFYKKDFSAEAIDTVDVDQIEELENLSYPFTHSDLGPEPFFSGLLEPIVAIGTAAVAIILFFTVRSK